MPSNKAGDLDYLPQNNPRFLATPLGTIVRSTQALSIVNSEKDVPTSFSPDRSQVTDQSISRNRGDLSPEIYYANSVDPQYGIQSFTASDVHEVLRESQATVYLEAEIIDSSRPSPRWQPEAYPSQPQLPPRFGIDSVADEDEEYDDDDYDDDEEYDSDYDPDDDYDDDDY